MSVGRDWDVSPTRKKYTEPGVVEVEILADRSVSPTTTRQGSVERYE